MAPKHIVGGFTKRAGRQVGSGRSDPRLLIGHNFARRVQEETTKYNSFHTFGKGFGGFCKYVLS